MEEIHETIQRILQNFFDEAVKQGKLGERYSDYWTEEILHRLANAGKQFGFEVHTRWHGGEWIYDLCWVERKNGNTLSVPLILACQWHPTPEIENDFEQLVWSRAALRVMIFDATFPWAAEGGAKEWAEAKIMELMRRARTFRNSQLNDQYLFCVWCRDEMSAEWHFKEMFSS